MHDSSPTMTAPEDSTTKGSFQLGTAMGQPESMSRGVPAGATPSPALTLLFQFVAEFPDLGGKADRVVIEADLVDEQRVPPGNGGGGRRPERLRRCKTRRRPFTSLMASLSLAAVMVLPVTRSISL